MLAGFYLRFAYEHRRFVGFGFLAALASSFGQTYFLGVFGPSIEASFSLSHTAWATIYLCGTLASALVLPWSGKRIDDLGLSTYTLAAIVVLSVGAFLMYWVQHALLLVLCVFMLRQGGQGLLSHISVTSMARYFEAGRGRAIALATLGFAAGEACLPVLALTTIACLGWRSAFVLVGLALVAVIAPLLMWLLKGHAVRHEDHMSLLASRSTTQERKEASWTREEVLRDPRFYLLMPGLLAPALIVTALFFTHLSLADAKGWSHSWITGSYVIYAASTTVVALACGPLIDRIGGAKLVPFMLLPMVVSLVVAGTLRQEWAVWPYFIFLGGSIGISHTAVAAMWAELYGVANIGSIKSAVSALAVFASAIGPVIMGVSMDAGIAIETVCLYFAAYALVASCLVGIALRLKTTRSA